MYSLYPHKVKTKLRENSQKYNSKAVSGKEKKRQRKRKEKKGQKKRKEKKGQKKRKEEGWNCSLKGHTILENQSNPHQHIQGQNNQILKTSKELRHACMKGKLMIGESSLFNSTSYNWKMMYLSLRYPR